jgi:acyl-CoA synthetase (NDP forming)
MDLEKFFFPRSLCIFGVSDSPGNLGREIVKNLNRFGYAGGVYGVGRREMDLEGRRVYTALDDLPESPGMAILLVPAPAIADALESCGKNGVRHVVIETGGFSEFGAERKGLEEGIARIARKWSIACMGPNCIGVTNRENVLCMPFVPLDPDEIREGKNSVICQSGGLVHEFIRRSAAEGSGLSKLVSVGNKLMLDENDILEYLVEDPETETIGMYLESIQDGRRLMDLAARTEKPILLLKGNWSPHTQEIASFHTAALSGDGMVTEAALRQAGIHQVWSPQEMVESFKVFSLPAMKGRNLAIVSRSGGQLVLLADEAFRQGFSLARLSPAVFDILKKRSGGEVIKRTNPIDLGDVYDEVFFLEVLEGVLKEGGVDGAVFFFDYEINASAIPEIVRGTGRLSRLYGKPVLLCMVPDRANWFAARDAAPFPLFVNPPAAFRALRQSLEHFRRKNEGKRESAPPDRAEDQETGQASADNPTSLAPAAHALTLVESYGVPVVAYGMARNKKEATDAARKIGYPVAMKQVEPAVLHKTEGGAVRLSVRDDEELVRAMDAMPADLYLVQRMAPDGTEVIIGGKRDAEFGPIVLFGLGGIFVEILKDVSVRVAPIDEAVAREMIHEIRGAALLNGARGRAGADVESLAKVIAHVSRLLVDHPEVSNIDINPVRVFEKGAGCLALDVKIGMVL